MPSTIRAFNGRQRAAPRKVAPTRATLTVESASTPLTRHATPSSVPRRRGTAYAVTVPKRPKTIAPSAAGTRCSHARTSAKGYRPRCHCEALRKSRRLVILSGSQSVFLLPLMRIQRATRFEGAVIRTQRLAICAGTPLLRTPRDWKGHTMRQ